MKTSSPLVQQTRMLETLGERPRTLLHGSLHPQRLFEKPKHVVHSRKELIRRTSSIMALGSPKSDNENDEPLPELPSYRFIFDDWSAFCAGPSGVDIAQVFGKCLSIEELEEGVHVGVTV